MLRPEELAHHVDLERLPCDPDLDPWVENLWLLRWRMPPGATYVSQTLPHPACTLSVEQGHPRSGVGEDRVVVTGVVTRRFDVVLAEQGWVLAAKFRPGGLAALTGIRAADLRDATVPASTVVGDAAAEALRGLDDAIATDVATARLQDTLRTLRTEPDPDFARVLRVVATMLSDRTLLRVADVEAATGVAVRTLQRLFDRYVGATPKWVLSRYRMHDAVAELDAGYDGPLADLAARFGWFDQAHFTRDFTDLVGVTPRAYQRRETSPR